MRKTTQLMMLLMIHAMFFISCKKEKQIVTPIAILGTPTNQPPICRPGGSQVLQLADSTYLDGSASSDTDGTITNYEWAKISGPDSFEIVSPNSAKTLVKGLVAGGYVFSLTVTDNSGLSSSAKVWINVLYSRPFLNSLKLDTTFRYTATYSGSSYPAFTTQKDFYIPILDSIENAQLKVYEKSKGPWSDVFPSSTGLSPSYSRNGGVITFRQLIIGWPSVEISVRVTASW